jgi:hypothetical protein
MLWYNPLQNTIYCGKLESTAYHVYGGVSWRDLRTCQIGGSVWSELLLPWT